MALVIGAAVIGTRNQKPADQTSLVILQVVAPQTSGQLQYAEIEWTGVDRSTQYEHHAKLPWTQELNAVPGTTLLVRATSKDDVRVNVYVGGSLVNFGTSSGPDTWAIAGAYVP